jgi:hypothetical protein
MDRKEFSVFYALIFPGPASIKRIGENLLYLPDKVLLPIGKYNLRSGYP